MIVELGSVTQKTLGHIAALLEFDSCTTPGEVAQC